MGLEKFDINTQEWLRRIYADEGFLLGRTTTTAEAHFPSSWPRVIDEQKTETQGRIYDLYNLSSDTTSLDFQLHHATRIKGLLGYVKRVFQGGGREGYDSDFLHYMVKSIDDRLASAVVARLYVNFDHSNLTDSRNVGNYLQRELKFKTRGIKAFKIAGPEMPNARRDSVVIWITERGVQTKEQTAKTIKGIVKSIGSHTVYGAGNVIADAPGIGFTYEPAELQARDWKKRYNGGSLVVSFGTLISIYLARGLWVANRNLDGYADKVAQYLVQDGIDPANLHLLSRATRCRGV